MKRVLLLLCAALAGCSAQTQAIRTNYASFNETIHFNQSQQMLLNLVRMKYRETHLFLQVGALSTSYDFEIDTAANFGRVSTVGNWGLRLGSSFSTRPSRERPSSSRSWPRSSPRLSSFCFDPDGRCARSAKFSSRESDRLFPNTFASPG